MEMHNTRLPYRKTNSFGKLALDYAEGSEDLRPFYAYAPDLAGIRKAIESRKSFGNHREVLNEVLTEKYQSVATEAQAKNIELLKSSDTFTITTAHQPNLFTGPLYFLHKIIHTISVAEYLSNALSEYSFVPVYYMGSEDADLDEIGHFYLGNEKFQWKTKQTGAVGRMRGTDLEEILSYLESRFGGEPFAPELLETLKDAYHKNNTIAQATFQLVNYLFGRFGLLVLDADEPRLKKCYLPVIKKELTESFSESLLKKTSAELDGHYKVQTEGRPINLFYLFEDGRRERIASENGRWHVLNSDLSFDEAEMVAEAENHPERFSPNVVLRPAYQETILPNILFAGGGGELGYWLQLKRIFEAAGVPYPVLLLRNSFLMIDPRAAERQKKAGIETEELFLAEIDLLNALVPETSWASINLEKYLLDQRAQYDALQAMAEATDATLQPHVAAMHTRARKELLGFEKKLKRALRRNLGEQKGHATTLKKQLFPGNQLQERVENFIPWYCRYGPEWIDGLLKNSPALEQEFTVLHLSPSA